MTFLLKTSYMKITSNIKKLRPLFSLYKKNDDIYQWTFVKSQIYAHCFIRRVREKIITSKKYTELIYMMPSREIDRYNRQLHAVRKVAICGKVCFG